MSKKQDKEIDKLRYEIDRLSDVGQMYSSCTKCGGKFLSSKMCEVIVEAEISSGSKNSFIQKINYCIFCMPPYDKIVKKAKYGSSWIPTYLTGASYSMGTATTPLVDDVKYYQYVEVTEDGKIVRAK